MDTLYIVILYCKINFNNLNQFNCLVLFRNITLYYIEFQLNTTKNIYLYNFLFIKSFVLFLNIYFCDSKYELNSVYFVNDFISARYLLDL